jgi:hypothetical protein
MPKIASKNIKWGLAFELLAMGHSRDAAVQVLQQEHHPWNSLEEVHRAYFPTGGSLKSPNLEGASREEILAEMKRIGEIRRKVSERMKALNDDPDFATMRNARIAAVNADLELTEKRKKAQKVALAEVTNSPDMGRQISIGLRKKIAEDPEFAQRLSQNGSAVLNALWDNDDFRALASKKSSAFFTQLNQEPSFAAKRDAKIEGVNKRRKENPAFGRRWLNALRAAKTKKTKAAAIRGFLEGQDSTSSDFEQTPVDANTPESHLMTKLMAEELIKALAALEPQERHAVNEEFELGIDLPKAQFTDDERQKHVASALKKMRDHFTDIDLHDYRPEPQWQPNTKRSKVIDIELPSALGRLTKDTRKNRKR